MSANPDPTTAEEQVNHQPVVTLITTQSRPQQIIEESDPTRKAISEALEQNYRNLEMLIEKWDSDRIESLADLMKELAGSRNGLEEVAELIRGRLNSA